MPIETGTRSDSDEAIRRSDEVLPHQQSRKETSIPSRYRILQQRSAGEEGAAYNALDLPTGDIVELRRLVPAPANADRRQQMAARFQLVQLLSHSTNIALRHVEWQSQPPFVVLESVSGRTLFEALEHTGALPIQSLLSISLQLASGLLTAHRLGLVHGSLNPKSVWLGERGEARLDFTGLKTNRVLDASTDNFYRAPEVLAGGEVDEASDVYSLGQLLQGMLATEQASDALRQLSARLAAGLRQLVRRATDADPANRPLLAEMNACLQEFVLLAGTNPCVMPSAASPEPTQPVDSTNEVCIRIQQSLNQAVQHVQAVSARPDAAQPNSAQPDAADATAESVVHLAEVDSAAYPIFDENDATRHDPLPSILTPVAAPHKPLAAGDRLGRFEIIRKLGEGGMGSVFQATDVADGRTVAIKVLSAAAALKSTALRRFQKEARLLAAVNSPHVTNLIAVSEEAGVHYIVLEYVDGTDLKKVLKTLAPLPEAQALSIAADVARALVDAHERGIVHRDIKPENILLMGDLAPGADRSTGLTGPFQVKLSDFGIARHIDQSESLAMTQAGAVIGTPLYMSPEQCKGQGEISPQSDVYSLGVTLFEMLVGRPPFQAIDPMKLAGMHCFEAPPAITKLNPRVSEAVAAIVAKALAKQPTERYADAAHLLRALDERRRGEPADINIHPLLPAHRPERLAMTDLAWDLESSPEELWPYVSNTERLNRALGLPSVTYQTELDPERGIRKFGSFKLGGVAIRWEEHPFEWVEGQRMGILREFDKGPFEWFLSTVELERLPHGGTRLHHKVRIAPRNLLGRVLAKVEADIKARRSLTKVYTRIDRTIRGKLGEVSTVDPFEMPTKLTGARRKRLEERMRRLEERGVDAQLVSRLGEFVAHGPAQEIAKLRPIALAHRFQVDQQEMLDACLLAASEGILTLQWDILCPVCRVAADARSTLKELQSHTYCEACNADFASDVANSIEMVFRAQADLRDTNVGVYCIGGPEHSPHVVAQLRIAPDERIELELTLPAGEYLLRGPQLSQSLTLHVQSSGAPSHCEIDLHPGLDNRRSPSLRAGKQILWMKNQYLQLQLVRLERTISRHDVITAAHAATVPLFRELFPQQVFDTSQLMSTEQVTLLATCVSNIDTLYSTLGDAEAYRLIQEHLKQIETAIRNGRGALVKVIGEGVLAVFDESADAVATALDLQRILRAGESTSTLELGVGVHRGPALVSTVNDRLDYFGAAARIAVALPGLAGQGVLLTETVFSDPLVAELLQRQNRLGEMKQLDLPGKSRQLVQSFSLPL